MRQWWGLLVMIVALMGGACTSEDKGTSVHCFDQQKSAVSLTAFVQTNCPTIADTVTTSPPTATGTAVSP